MKNRFLISDTHFNHAKMLTFLSKVDGKPVRPFASVEEMDEAMIQNWNNVVKPCDTVIHLGDVTFNNKYYLSKIRPRLKGKIQLIVGNHDDFMDKDFMASFEKVMFWKPIKEHEIFASHLPVMPSQFRGKCTLNVHGHIHERHVRDLGDFPKKPLWACMSVEHINYTPVSIEELVDNKHKYFTL